MNHIKNNGSYIILFFRIFVQIIGITEIATLSMNICKWIQSTLFRLHTKEPEYYKAGEKPNKYLIFQL